MVNCHSHVQEQSCGRILPMSLQVPSLMYATMALSSLHRMSLLTHPPKHYFLEAEVTNLISASLRHLRQELESNNAQASHASLDTIRNLCVCEIYSGKADRSWRIHAEGAKALIESLKEATTGLVPESIHWLTARWYSSVESLAAITYNGLSTGQVELGPRALISNVKSYVLDIYTGYSSDLDMAFKEIGAASWERRRLESDKKDSWSSISESDLISEADWLEQSVYAMISRDLQSGLTLPAHVKLSAREIRQFEACNEAYQYVALIHIYRRVRRLPSASVEVQKCTKAILQAVSKILPVEKLSPWVLLTTPLFTAG